MLAQDQIKVFEFINLFHYLSIELHYILPLKLNSHRYEWITALRKHLSTFAHISFHLPFKRNIVLSTNFWKYFKNPFQSMECHLQTEQCSTLISISCAYFHFTFTKTSFHFFHNSIHVHIVQLRWHYTSLPHNLKTCTYTFFPSCTCIGKYVKCFRIIQ